MTTEEGNSIDRHVNTPKRVERMTDGGNGGASFAKALVFFLLLWFILGLIAFVYSLVCFGKSGSLLEKIIGFLLALFFGPFYWVYYAANSNYCR
jgi:hypothetical protein